MIWIIADCFESFLIIFFVLDYFGSFWTFFGLLWVFVGLCEFYLSGGGSLWIAVNFLICV